VTKSDKHEDAFDDGIRWRNAMVILNSCDAVRMETNKDWQWFEDNCPIVSINNPVYDAESAAIDELMARAALEGWSDERAEQEIGLMHRRLEAAPEMAGKFLAHQERRSG
jgi:hypothetical protein